MKRFITLGLITVFLVFSFGMPSVADNKPSASIFIFPDTLNHWAKGEIESVYQKGLMQGIGEDEKGFKLFAPQANVNRYQLAVVLDRTFDLDGGAMRFIGEQQVSDYFPGLEDANWYSEAVTLGIINNIFAVKDDFKGDEDITRLETARSIYRAFQAKGINVPMILLMPIYDDTLELCPADTNAMVFVSNTGIMKGNDNLFRPDDKITRAELAKVLNHVAQLIEMNPVDASPTPKGELELKTEKSASPLIAVDLQIPVIKGLQDKEIEKKLNRLLENDAMERLEEMNEEAEACSDFILTAPYHKFNITSRCTQYYVAGNILSFYVDYYTFTGGAHGMTERIAYNFDLDTGLELTLSDFFAAGLDYTKIVDEKVQEVIDENPEMYFTGEWGFKGIAEDQGFYLENNNIIVYFLQYEIAPYAAGIRTFPIPIQSSNNKYNDNDEAVVIKLVQEFGNKLKNVSLLAPANEVKKSVQENYGNFISKALLTEWQNNLQCVPGRRVSSPWPECIEVIGAERLSDDRWQIQGEIIEITSLEMLNGGFAAKQPITITAEKIANSWLITAVVMHGYMEYTDKQYGFNFSLPDSWQGYSIVSDKWKGSKPGSSQTVETGPLVSIRHPQWTIENQWQDIPIMVFTIAQWESLQLEDFIIVSAAPYGPKELGRNNKYVFALPARYNFAFPTGYQEVEQILANNPLQPFTIGNIKVDDVLFAPGKLTVSGTARVWEANVVYEISDNNGEVIFDGFTTAAVGAPDWGEFSFTIEGDLKNASMIRVFTTSAKDGSKTDIIEYALKD